jgi:hypothetical protein
MKTKNFRRSYRYIVKHLAFIGVSLLLVVATGTDVEARRRRIRLETAATLTRETPTDGGFLRPNNRKYHVRVSLGAGVNLKSHTDQFTLQEEFGAYLTTISKHLGAGAYLSQSLGGGDFAFSFGGKVWYDFQPWENLGFYITPSYTMGMSIYDKGSVVVGWHNLLAVEARLTLANRGFVYVQPVGFEFLLGSKALLSQGSAVRYQMLVGGGVSF